MTAVWLIALNFMRQHRIVAYVFLAWVLGFGVLAVFGGFDAGDVLALFHQQAVYGVIYTLFLAAASVQSERQSRRIIAVLAKGIHRHEYLAGLMLGSVLMTGLYMVTVGLVNSYLALRMGFTDVTGIWSILAAAALAAVVVAAIATMFSTFAHPMVGTIGAILVAGLPAGLQALKGGEVSLFAPAAHVLQQVFHSDFSRGWAGGWTFAPIALAQALVFWALAGVIFARKDVTTAIE